MPLVNIKLIEGVYSQDQKREMIKTRDGCHGRSRRGAHAPGNRGDHRGSEKWRLGHRRQGYLSRRR